MQRSNKQQGVQVQTQLPRFRKAAVLGDRIDGWRVCGLRGWDKGKVYFVVMVETRGLRRRAT